MILFQNPIFRREFSAVSRSPKYNAIIAVYLFLLSATLLGLWPSGGIHSVVSSEGKKIFSIFFSINLLLIFLIAPSFSAASISSEKENNTFAGLFVTLLTPFEILLGKLAASILLIIFTVAFSVPIAAICSMTGGISNILLLKIILVIFLSAISYGIIGLACSSSCERTSSSVVTNYSLIAIFAGASWLPSELLGNLLPSFQGLFQIIRSFSPFDALFFLLYPENYKLTSRIIMTKSYLLNPFNVYIVFSMLLSFTAFIVFQRRIFKPLSRTFVPHGEYYTGLAKTVKRKLTWPFYLIDPLKRKKNIRMFSNPVFVAELRSRIFGNPKFLIRTVSLIFILSLLIMTLTAVQFGAMIRPDSVRMAAIIFQLGVMAMLAPGLSSGLITDEISSGTLVMLRMTPLSPFSVVMGKLKATFFYAIILFISAFFVLFSMAFLEHQAVFPEGSIISGAWWTALLQKAGHAAWWAELWTTYRRIVFWTLILLLGTLLFLSCGLISSSFAKNTGTATASAYLLTALFCVASFSPLIFKEKLSASVAGLILSFNPLAAALQITNGAFAEYPNIWKTNIFLMLGVIFFFSALAIARIRYLFRTRT